MKKKEQKNKDVMNNIKSGEKTYTFIPETTAEAYPT